MPVLADASAVSPLRILLVTHYFSTHRGGVEQVAGQLATRLATTPGLALTWLASDCDAPPSTDRIASPRCIAIPSRNFFERLGFPWPLWTLEGLRMLRAEVRQCDILHIHDFIYFGNLAAFVFARTSGKPVVVTQHIGDIPYDSLALRLVIRAINRTIGRWVLGRATQVAFISDAVRTHFQRFVNFQTAPLYIPNGVDIAIFHPVADDVRNAIRAGLGVAPDDEVILYVGRFVDKKGPPLLGKLARASPKRQWWFAGWGDPDSSAHPSTWNLDNVTVFGDRSGATLADLYRAADLLVLASLSEGFPLVVQEAMACGTRALVSTPIIDGAPDARDLVLTCPIEPPESAAAGWELSISEALAARTASLRETLSTFAATRWSWAMAVERYRTLFVALAGPENTARD